MPTEAVLSFTVNPKTETSLQSLINLLSMIVDYRAAKILFNFLKSNRFDGSFIIPANSCPIIPLTFLSAGVDFTFIDISAVDYCLDKSKTLASLGNKSICGIVWVRSYGIQTDEEDFFHTIKTLRSDVAIIDDKCLCRPNINLPYTHADLTIYSTGYGKFLDLGKGAFAFMNNSKYLYEKQATKYVLNHEKDLMNSFYSHLASGMTFKGNQKFFWLDSQVVDDEKISSQVAENLEKIDQHKNSINTIYIKHLPNGIKLKTQYQDWRFNILVPAHQKGNIIKALFKAKLFASSHYASIPQVFGKPPAEIASAVESKIINLFNDFHYSQEMAIETCKIILKELKTK